MTGAPKIYTTQTDLLRELLDHAKTRSTWHRERLQGVDPATFRVADLDSLPTMKKGDVNEHFDEISTEPRLTRSWCESHLQQGNPYTDGTFCVIASGGTSGHRTVQVYTAQAAAGVIGLGSRMDIRHMIRTGVTPAPGKVVWIAAAPGGAHATDVFARLGGGLTDGQRFAVTDPVGDVIAGLNEIQPALIMLYSSYLKQLIQAQSDGRLSIAPSQLALTSETPSPADMAKAQEIWNCSISSSWASVEFGVMGRSSFFQEGHLLSDDLLLIEAVDEHGRPVQPDTQAPKLLITNLYNRSMPLIRYELTDQLTIYSWPADCGSCLRAASLVSGRLDDHFVYDGGTPVHSHLFRHVLEQRPGILEYQVRQTRDGATVSLVAGGAVDPVDIGATLERDLERTGVPSPRVNIRLVPSIERTTAQKLKRFIALQE